MIWLDQSNGWEPVASAALKHQTEQQLSLSQKQHTALQNQRSQIRIRDLHLMLRTCTDGACLNTVVSNYKALVKHKFGANVDATRLSRTPFFYAFNTPELRREDSPWFTNRSIRQTYVKGSWGHFDGQSKRLLVCVTATIPTLNMPLVMFHAYAQHYFDGIAYVFDPGQDGYQSGKAEISNSVNRLVDQLQPQKLGFLGVSSGAAMAIRLGQQERGSRTLASSPVLKPDNDVTSYLLAMPPEELVQKLAILYANNATDLPYQALFESLNQNNTTIAHNLTTISPSHATLATTTVNGLFAQLMAWLNHSATEAFTAS